MLYRRILLFHSLLHSSTNNDLDSDLCGYHIRPHKEKMET